MTRTLLTCLRPSPLFKFGGRGLNCRHMALEVTSPIPVFNWFVQTREMSKPISCWWKEETEHQMPLRINSAVRARPTNRCSYKLLSQEMVFTNFLPNFHFSGCFTSPLSLVISYRWLGGTLRWVSDRALLAALNLNQTSFLCLLPAVSPTGDTSTLLWMNIEMVGWP